MAVASSRVNRIRRRTARVRPDAARFAVNQAWSGGEDTARVVQRSQPVDPVQILRLPQRSHDHFRAAIRSSIVRMIAARPPTW